MRKLLSVLLWSAVAILGAGAFAVLAFHRGEIREHLAGFDATRWYDLDGRDHLALRDLGSEV